jgi:hypothetical protein
MNDLRRQQTEPTTAAPMPGEHSGRRTGPETSVKTSTSFPGEQEPATPKGIHQHRWIRRHPPTQNSPLTSTPPEKTAPRQGRDEENKNPTQQRHRHLSIAARKRARTPRSRERIEATKPQTPRSTTDTEEDHHVGEGAGELFAAAISTAGAEELDGRNPSYLA